MQRCIEERDYVAEDMRLLVAAQSRKIEQLVRVLRDWCQRCTLPEAVRTGGQSMLALRLSAAVQSLQRLRRAFAEWVQCEDPAIFGDLRVADVASVVIQDSLDRPVVNHVHESDGDNEIRPEPMSDSDSDSEDSDDGDM
jgi:hypothetical protein